MKTRETLANSGIEYHDLIRKYNMAGPRYTSYPTVPYWETSPTEEQWIDSIALALNEASETGVGAALYIHIPFCESLCTYCGCSVRISRNHSVGNPYVDTVLKEWDLYLERLKGKLKNSIRIGEIHLGGGTPTFLSPSELKRLIDGILSKVSTMDTYEFSVEADPRVTTDAHLEALSSVGFTRLSLGVQDFDPKVQEIVHRLQSVDQVKRITDSARTMGYTGINYDLIYGLPLQTLDSIEFTINHVQKLSPDRIAFYSYAHVPWMKPGQRRFSEADLPTGEAKRALYERGRAMLESVGYHEVGMDHFALETDSLWKSSREKLLHRNFMGYTRRQVNPLIGLGMSSISDSWRIFSQNEKLLETYQKRIEKGEIPITRGHVLTDEDLLIRRHILNLMTQMETNWNAAEYEDTHLGSVLDRLEEFEKDGLVKTSTGHCEILSEGRPFLRNICMAFDARLAVKAPQTRLFSQTI